MPLLSKDEILNAQDLNYEDVDVPEWGGAVRVKMLSGAERDAFEAATVSQNGVNVRVNMINIRARLVALTVVDETGQRMFTDQDVEKLGQKSAAALNRVFERARALNGLTPEAAGEASANFTPGRSGDSTSD